MSRSRRRSSYILCMSSSTRLSVSRIVCWAFVGIFSSRQTSATGFPERALEPNGYGVARFPRGTARSPEAAQFVWIRSFGIFSIERLTGGCKVPDATPESSSYPTAHQEPSPSTTHRESSSPPEAHREKSSRPRDDKDCALRAGRERRELLFLLGTMMGTVMMVIRGHEPLY